MRSSNIHEKRFLVAAVLAMVAVACSSSSDSGDGAGPSSDAGTGTNDSSVEGDASVPTLDAGADSGSSSAPITGLANDTWTWVDFPDSACANGSPTGIAVSPHAGATNLMIYFEGGGDCVDATTCWGPDPGATNLSGFTSATFAAKGPKIPTLNRTTPNNPFAAMSMVYVPYCTGDMHSGTVLANLPAGDGGSIPTYFYGARDMDIFLKRLVPTFPSMTRIWELGTSAGGYGTFLNFPRVSAAFGVGVDIVDDSGPPIVPKSSTTNTNAGLFDVWGIDAGLPAACSSYNSLRQVLDYDLTAQQAFSPPGKFGFMSFTEDSTIGPDFGYNDVTEYPAVLQAFTSSLPVSDNVATFLVGNYPSHVVESDLSLVPDYFPWMIDMIARNASWVDETHDGGM